MTPANKSQHIKICNRNPGNPHGTHSKNTSKPEINKKRGTTVPENLETKCINIQQEKKCGEVYLMVL